MPTHLEELAQWRAKVPADLAEGTAIEAIGKLKKAGCIRSITLINGLPRSASTILAKALASSDDFHLPQNTVFHEVLTDSVAVPPGSNILMGSLVELGVVPPKPGNKPVDLVLKTMSDEFTGDALKSFLPYVDNVVSTVRDPARHISCIVEKYAYDENLAPGSIEKVARDSWNAMNDNINMIDSWRAAHSDQKLQHAVISTGQLTQLPEETLKYVCEEFSKGNHLIRFNQDMVDNWRPKVFDPYCDFWAINEMRATRFNRAPYIPFSRKDVGSFGDLYDELKPMFDSIKLRYPHAQSWAESVQDKNRQHIL